MDIRIAAVVIAALVAVCLLVQILVSNIRIELNSYTVESDRLPDGFDGFRIAQVSDLHNSAATDKLLSRLEDAEPNIIVITGDMIDSRNTDVGIALDFAREAVKIAPCYYVNGNHESRLDEYAELKNGLTELGVTVLEDSRIEIEYSGDKITLIGVVDPSFKTSYLSDGEMPVMESALNELVCESDGYTVLLSHRPELFEIYAEHGVDLVFSGHAHGGQLRLPFIGGVYAPGQGLFPKYDAGVFTSGRTSMVVSRGIGKSIISLRINNSPEIVVAELRSR